MRCSYSAGALYALVKEFEFTDPDIIIATSGSAGSAFYFLSKQYDAIKDIWTTRLSTPRFISFLRVWEIMNVDYVIDEVFKKQVPLDVVSLKNTKTTFEIPVTNTRTHKVRYITNTDNDDPFEVLRAAKAIPVLFGKKVKIDGDEDVDGAVSNTFEDTVQKAKDLGADVIIAIDVRESYKQRKFLHITSGSSNVIFIANTKLPVGLAKRNKKRLEKAFNLGYKDAAESRQLKEILG